MPSAISSYHRSTIPILRAKSPQLNFDQTNSRLKFPFPESPGANNYQHPNKVKIETQLQTQINKSNRHINLAQFASKTLDQFYDHEKSRKTKNCYGILTKNLDNAERFRNDENLFLRDIMVNREVDPQKYDPQQNKNTKIPVKFNNSERFQGSRQSKFLNKLDCKIVFK